MNPNPFLQAKNRNYLIAGIAALIALLSFFIFTYGVPSVNYSGPGSDLIKAYVDKVAGVLTYNGPYFGQMAGIVWVVVLLALAVFVVAALFLFLGRPFGARTPVPIQARWVAYSFIGAGALALVIQILTFVLANQKIQETLGAYSTFLGNSSSFRISLNWGFGAWLIAICMLAVIVAGVLELVQQPQLRAATTQGNAAQYPPNMYQGELGSTPAQYPPMSQYPAQSQYPPVSGQYPSGSTQYPPQQTQYPPTSGQYPPQQPQYPPASGQYPPQQPQYPPASTPYPPQ